MGTYTLVVGNKNYSSWSMRPWVLMTHFGLPFEEVLVRFDSFDPGSRFKAVVGALAPTGKVPLLVDGDLVVWDSLAIAETLAERFPQHPLWPTDPAARARARSLCAEMHSGFGALRSACPMNRAHYRRRTPPCWKRWRSVFRRAWSTACPTAPRPSSPTASADSHACAQRRVR